MRVWVLLDINKLLLSGTKVKVGRLGDAVWVDFLYECLRDFYYGCGRLGHMVRECSESSQVSKQLW